MTCSCVGACCEYAWACVGGGHRYPSRPGKPLRSGQARCGAVSRAVDSTIRRTLLFDGAQQDRGQQGVLDPVGMGADPLLERRVTAGTSGDLHRQSPLADADVQPHQLQPDKLRVGSGDHDRSQSAKAWPWP